MFIFIIYLYLWKLLVLYLRYWIKVLTTTIDVHTADISTDTLFHYCTCTNLACFAGAGGTINLACFAGATTIDVHLTDSYRLTHCSIVVFSYTAVLIKTYIYICNPIKLNDIIYCVATLDISKFCNKWFNVFKKS